MINISSFKAEERFLLRQQDYFNLFIMFLKDIVSKWKQFTYYILHYNGS